MVGLFVAIHTKMPTFFLFKKRRKSNVDKTTKSFESFVQIIIVLLELLVPIRDMNRTEQTAVSYLYIQWGHYPLIL